MTILDAKSPKDSTKKGKKKIELVNKFIKQHDTKRKYKNIAFLYTNNKL